MHWSWLPAAEICTALLCFRFAMCFPISCFFGVGGLVCGLFRTMRLSGQIVYEPLLWAIEVSSYCPVHLRRSTALAPLRADSESPCCLLPARYCERCGYWLACQMQQISFAPGHPNGEAKGWSSRQVGELLAMLPKLDAGPLGNRFA